MLLSGICLVLTSAKPPVGVCFSYIVFVLSCPGCCPCCSQCSAEDRALYRPHRQARLSVLLRARPQWGVPLLKLIELSLFSKVAGTNSLRFFLYLLSLLLPSLHAWFSVFILFYFLNRTWDVHTLSECSRVFFPTTPKHDLVSGWFSLPHLHDVWHPHLSPFFYQPRQTIMSQKKLSPRSNSYLESALFHHRAETLRCHLVVTDWKQTLRVSLIAYMLHGCEASVAL